MKWFLGIAALVLAGCAYDDPYGRLETTTPSLSSGQMSALRNRAQSPETLGIQVLRQGGFVALGGVNQLCVTSTVVASLVGVPTEKPFDPGGRFRVPVVLATVNGHGGVRVMLDSGSNQALCGYELARSVELVPIAGLNEVGSHGIGGFVDNLPAVAASVRIGGVELRKLVTMINPDVHALRVQQFWGSTPVMLLGVNRLRSLSYLTVDSLRGKVVFGVGESYRPSSRGFVTSVPLSWQNDLPCVPVKVDNKEPSVCVVDTGGDYGLLLSRAQATKFGYWQPGEGKVNPSTGVAGAGLAATYNVGRVVLGGATLVTVPARTIVIGPEPVGGQMLVGNQVLRQYRITFDFKNQLFWLEKDGR